MEKIIKKIYLLTATIAVIVLCFIVFNFIVFTGIVNATMNNSFASARTYMLSAEKINELYIFPLSHLTRWDHPVTEPFYFVRDKLYNTGLSKFPKNEGEKEIWWYKIRYAEFRELVEDKLFEYTLNKYPKKYLYSKVNDFIMWNNELYSHIEPMAKAKITDKEFGKQKLALFVNLAILSQDIDNCLSGELRAEKQGKWGPFRREGMYPAINHAQKYDKVYNIYINLVDYSKKYEKDSYDYFVSNSKIWGAKLRHDFSLSILQAKFYNYKLDCNDIFLKVFADSDKEIRDYYFANQGTLSYGLKMRLSMDALSTYPLMIPITYKCRNNPDFKDYIEYIIKKQSDMKNPTIEIIKDLYLRDLKTLKQYDQLEKVKRVLKEK